MQLCNVSVFMPRDNAWYRMVAAQIAHGFAAHGFVVSTHCGVLDESRLANWIKLHRPRLIFEMNRPRADIPFLNKSIIHLCWVVDFNGRAISEFQGSEITYLFGPKWLEKVTVPGCYRWMGPGVCPESYFPEPSCYRYDASFVGHIPNPWSDEELARNVAADGAFLAFSAILPHLVDEYNRHKPSLKTHQDYLKLIRELATREFQVEIDLNHQLEYDLTGRLIRLINRRELIDKLITVTDLALFGPQNWQNWPEYQRFYRHFLETSQQMRAVYHQSRINLHEGNGMHFRVMDCMASAGLMFIRRNDYDDKPGGIKNFFEPGQHYVDFDLDDVADKYAYYQKNHQLADKIRQAGFHAVLKQHTWRHRVADILGDLKQLGLV